MKLSTFVFFVAMFWGVALNSFFGWNPMPESFQELIADFLFAGLMILSVFFRTVGA